MARSRNLRRNRGPPGGDLPSDQARQEPSTSPADRRHRATAAGGSRRSAMPRRPGLTGEDVARAVGIRGEECGRLSSGYTAGTLPPPPSQPGLAARGSCGCAARRTTAQLSDWVSALNRIRRGPGRGRRQPAPYRGLASFQPEDAAWFFGREAITARLVRLATDGFVPRCTADRGRAVRLGEVVVAASRADPVTAGLVPAEIRRFTPRCHAPGRARPAAGRLLAPPSSRP